MAKEKMKYETNKDPRFQLFPAQRRKIVLEKITANVKDNNANLVFTLCMPLTGQSLLGFPAFLGPAYEDVNKEGSLTSVASLGKFELPGLTLEFYRTEEAKKRIIHMVDKTLYHFVISREKEGDTFTTVLRFRVRMEETKARLCWWHDFRGTDQWIDFTPTADALKESDDAQMSLADDRKSEEDEDEESSGFPTQTQERARAVAD